MWERWLREITTQVYWLKRDLIRNWHLDTPGGIMGILVIISGIGLLIILGQGLAGIFRFTVPWVSGRNISEVYWQSISFGFKASFLFLFFCIVLITFLIYKIKEHR